jgi:hypothetical protein
MAFHVGGKYFMVEENKQRGGDIGRWHLFLGENTYHLKGGGYGFRANI